MKAVKDFSLQPVTEQIIGAAFEVHNVLGYGFLERVYQRAMQVELQSRGIKAELEPLIKVQFKGVIVGDYAADLLVAGSVVVELKTDAVYQPVHEAQLLNELRGTGFRLGYLAKHLGFRDELKAFRSHHPEKSNLFLLASLACIYGDIKHCGQKFYKSL